MKRRPTLRSALLWRLVLASVIPILLVGFLSLRYLTRSSVAAAETQNRLLSRALAAEVEAFLSEPFTALSGLGDLSLQHARHAHLPIKDLLARAAHFSNLFESIFLLNRQGVIIDVGLARQVNGQREDYLGLDLSQRAYVRQALASQQPVWSETFVSLISGDLAMTLSIPGDDFILVGSFSLRRLHRIIDNTTIQAGLVPAILDGRGNLIFYPERDLARQRLNLSNLGPVAAGLKGAEGTSLYRWRGEQYLGSVTRLDRPNWLILVSQPATEAYRQAGLITRIFLGGMLAAIALSILTAQVIARRLSRPLAQLADGAQAIAESDYSSPLPATAHRETADLARALREMAGKIQAREEELMASREHYLRLFNANNDAIFVIRVTADGKLEQFLEVNDTACSILGYHRSELLALTPFDIDLRQWEASPRGARINARFPAEKSALFETHFLRKDGVRLPVELNVHRCRIDGQPAALALARDISERSDREAELRRARNAAEQANRAKSLFLANMSHEIRTPMNGVLGMLDLLVDSGLDRQQRELLGMAKASAASLLRVIDDILDVSRIEAGKLEFETVAFPLAATIRQAVQVFQLRAAQKGLSLDLELAPDLPPWVLGDPGRLQQVLVNLVGNAIKFTEKGHVGIIVDRPPGLGKDGELVRFSVSDTGIGIAADRQHRLFKTFSQVEAGPNRKYGGSGLGLAISREIIARCGGEIGVNSEEGAGSTFTFTLRLPPAEPAPTPAAADSGNPDLRAALPQADSVTGARILVAEDNPVNQLLARRLLEKRGWRVSTVDNGAAAVNHWREGEIDLILMDIQMPQMDGLAATREIRRQEAQEKRALATPIVALTAHAFKDDEEHCLAAGMDAYLSKPIAAEKLYAVCEKLLAPTAVASPGGSGPN